MPCIKMTENFRRSSQNARVFIDRNDKNSLTECYWTYDAKDKNNKVRHHNKHLKCMADVKVRMTLKRWIESYRTGSEHPGIVEWTSPLQVLMSQLHLHLMVQLWQSELLWLAISELGHLCIDFTLFILILTRASTYCVFSYVAASL